METQNSRTNRIQKIMNSSYRVFVGALVVCTGFVGCATYEPTAQVRRLIPGQIPEDLQLTDTGTLVSFPRTEVTDSLEEQVGPGVGRFLASVPPSGLVDPVPGEADHDTSETPGRFELLSTIPRAGE